MTSTLAALQLPVDCSHRSEAEAVRALRACEAADLRQAQRQHRRALDALTDGRYEALSDSTRRRLIDRLRRHLRLLDAALSPSSPSKPSSGDAERWAASLQGLWASLRALLW